MKFAFTDEQRMLRDTSQAFLAAESDSSAVRAASTSDKTYDPELWQKICEDMYWQGILAPESCDGLGLGWVEMAMCSKLPAKITDRAALCNESKHGRTDVVSSDRHARCAFIGDCWWSGD